MTNSIKSRRKLAFAWRMVKEPSVLERSDVIQPETPIRWPRDVYELMAPLADVEQGEVLWLIPLNSQHKTKGPVMVSRGTLNSSLVSPREVFLRAMVANAAAIIVVHNHPSGDPTPSPDDQMITQQLVAAGRLLDMPVRDHVILGLGRYVSMAELGLMG